MMRGSQITIGGVYLAKVSGKIVPVRVLSKYEHFYRGGRSHDAFICENMTTGRKIRVRSVQRFRSQVSAAVAETPIGTAIDDGPDVEF
jgi:hypothetical protein